MPTINDLIATENDLARAQADIGRLRAVLRRWQRADYIRLHAGEMTAQEMRSVLAVLKAVSLEIEAYLPDASGEQTIQEDEA